MKDSVTSKQMRTFSFDGEGIYEMPEGVGEYVLASDARAEIERLRAERDKWQARAMALFWTGGDADGVTCADIRKATDGYNEWLKRSHAPDETTALPPIDRAVYDRRGDKIKDLMDLLAEVLPQHVDQPKGFEDWDGGAENDWVRRARAALGISPEKPTECQHSRREPGCTLESLHPSATHADVWEYRCAVCKHRFSLADRTA